MPNHPKVSPPGFRNNSTVCYLNSVMQMLFSIDESNAYLSKDHMPADPTERALLIRYLYMLCYGWTQHRGVLDACKMASLLINNSTFLTSGQNDASEALFDILENPFINKQYRNEFVGKYKNSVVCQHCQESSETFDEFTSLHIAVPETSDVYSIAKLIGNHCSREYLAKGEEYKCEKCSRSTRALKKMVIDTFPANLIVVLKRGRFGHKTSNAVRVNPTFSMERNGAVHCYSLRSMCAHSGSTSGGHYIACASKPLKGGNRRWFFCDDEYVEEIRPSNVFRDSTTVCLLAYRKVETKPATLSV